MTARPTCTSRMLWNLAVLVGCQSAFLVGVTGAFVNSNLSTRQSQQTIPLFAAKLSPLPKGISPFESKDMVAGLADDLRKRSQAALTAAQQDGYKLLEIDFPPLLIQGKSQFDDFDNVQELNQNRDWCVEWLPAMQNDKDNKDIWFILPDVKEVEICKEEWGGQRYRQAASFTSIEAVTNHYTGGAYAKPWGATFANGMQNLFKNDMLGNDGSLDELSKESPNVHVVCQPGNGGPVEDWINVETLHNACPSKDVTTLIVNGALDKVRDGYYPAIVFPQLAATVDRFYRKFEPILALKTISDKGQYGWLFRVYPEPWQVVLQTVKKDKSDRQYVENTVVYTSETRPSYAEAVQKLLQAAAAQSAAK